MSGITAQYRVLRTTPASGDLDLTADATQVSFSRAIAGPLVGNLQPGGCQVVLDNATGRWSPRVMPVGSVRLFPRQDLLVQARPTSGSGAWSTLFTGHIDRIVQQGDMSGRTVVLDCRDNLDIGAVARTFSSMFINATAKEIIDAILANAETTVVTPVYNGGQFWSLQPPFVAYDNVQALSALNDFLSQTGLWGYVDGDSLLQLHERNFWLGGTPVASYEELHGLQIEDSASNVVNKVQLRGEPRTMVDSLQVVTRLQNPVSIPAGQGLGFFLSYLDPRDQNTEIYATEVMTPVSGLDWFTNDNSGGDGDDRTSACSLRVGIFGSTIVTTVFNGHSGDVWLSTYQVRGKPIVTQPALATDVENVFNQQSYGVRTAIIEAPILARFDLFKERADDLLNAFANPMMRGGFSLVNQYPDVLERDCADVVHITNSVLGVADRFLITSVNHDIDFGGGLAAHQVSCQFLSRPYRVEERRLRDFLEIQTGESDPILPAEGPLEWGGGGMTWDGDSMEWTP